MPFTKKEKAQPFFNENPTKLILLPGNNNDYIFLDTQVSLAPTHVSKLVGWLVGWSHFRISNLWSVTIDQIKKVQKTKSIYFLMHFQNFDALSEF